MAGKKASQGAKFSTAFERPTKGAWQVLRGLATYLGRYKWLLFLALLFSVSSNLLMLFGPKLSGLAIDSIKAGAGAVNFERVFFYAAMMILFYVVSALLGYLLAYIMLKVSRNVAYTMRRDVFDKITTLPLEFFDTHQAGDIISVISYDIDTINTSLSNDVVQLLASVITVVGSFVMMLGISPKLLLVFVITIPISVFLTKYMSTRVRGLYRQRSAKLGALNGFVEEFTEGQKTTKAYGGEQAVIARFDTQNESAVTANYKADRFACMMGPSVNFVNNLSLALISVFGGLLYMAGGISLGNISSFVLYSRKFSGPINEFANIVSEIQSALAAAERVLDLLKLSPEVADEQGAVVFNQVIGDVNLQHVNFGYTKDRQILTDLCLHATPGSTTAIVGPTGGGKTTIINLLMRFYDIDSGQLLVDGIQSSHIARSSLRGAYSMVLQDTWLFYGTVYENIAYANEHATLEQVIQAAKAAKIHKFIMSLPKGYDTIITEGGNGISKGQKQLLTIARAMVSTANMLILDEATSNVDTATEQAIQTAMLKLMQGRTCFVIAHRLSTIQNADNIVVIQNGQIVEQGKHRQLLERRGEYYNMYAAQFEGSK